jgi:hypothetical protein
MAVDAAKAQLKGVQVLQESLPNPGSDEDRTRRGIYDQQVAAAEASLRLAQAQERGARAVLDRRLAIRKNPAALEAAVHQAEGQAAQAEAVVGTARARLAQLQAPAPSEEYVLINRPTAVQIATLMCMIGWPVLIHDTMAVESWPPLLCITHEALICFSLAAKDNR